MLSRYKEEAFQLDTNKRNRLYLQKTNKQTVNIESQIFDFMQRKEAVVSALEFVERAYNLISSHHLPSIYTVVKKHFE